MDEPTCAEFKLAYKKEGDPRVSNRIFVRLICLPRGSPYLNPLEACQRSRVGGDDQR